MLSLTEEPEGDETRLDEYDYGEEYELDVDDLDQQEDVTDYEVSENDSRGQASGLSVDEPSPSAQDADSDLEITVSHQQREASSFSQSNDNEEEELDIHIETTATPDTGFESEDPATVQAAVDQSCLPTPPLSPRIRQAQSQEHHFQEPAGEAVPVQHDPDVESLMAFAQAPTTHPYSQPAQPQEDFARFLSNLAQEQPTATPAAQEDVSASTTMPDIAGADAAETEHQSGTATEEITEMDETPLTPDPTRAQRLAEEVREAALHATEDVPPTPPLEQAVRMSPKAESHPTTIVEIDAELQGDEKASAEQSNEESTANVLISEEPAGGQEDLVPPEVNWASLSTEDVPPTEDAAHRVQAIGTEPSHDVEGQVSTSNSDEPATLAQSEDGQDFQSSVQDDVSRSRDDLSEELQREAAPAAFASSVDEPTSEEIHQIKDRAKDKSDVEMTSGQTGMTQDQADSAGSTEARVLTSALQDPPLTHKETTTENMEDHPETAAPSHSEEIPVQAEASQAVLSISNEKSSEAKPSNLEASVSELPDLPKTPAEESRTTGADVLDSSTSQADAPTQPLDPAEREGDSSVVDDLLAVSAPAITTHGSVATVDASQATPPLTSEDVNVTAGPVYDLDHFVSASEPSDSTSLKKGEHAQEQNRGDETVEGKEAEVRSMPVERALTRKLIRPTDQQ